MESVGLQTGDSLDDLPGASAAPSGGDSGDQGLELELESSSELLQDLNSSTSSGNEAVTNVEPTEHLESLEAEDMMDDSQPSARALISSTPTIGYQQLDEIMILVTNAQIQDNSLELEVSGRTTDQASGLDVETEQYILEGGQESFDSPENSDAYDCCICVCGKN